MELIVVIVIIGVLAAVAIPRPARPEGFSSRGFHDEALATVRYAQKTAIAWRRQVFVCVTSTGITVASSAGCATPITHPATGSPLQITAPSPVTLSTVTFRFDGIGRTIDNSTGNPTTAPITITFTTTVSGDPARQIVVEAETGYVHP